MSSELLRDELSSFTGINLTSLFDNWIFNPGFSHFHVDSMETVDLGGGNFSASVYIRQKLKGATQFHVNVPLTVTLYDEQLIPHEFHETVSGQNSTIQLDVNFNPLMVALNADDKLNLAQAADEVVIAQTGNYNFKYGRMNVDVTDVQDSVLLRIEHHWVAPDNDHLPGNATKISDYRYWTVGGIHLEKMAAQAEIFYDGRNSTSNRNGQLDNTLLEAGEDSVILLYRENSSEKWTEYQFYSKNTHATTLDKFGKMELSQLMAGEYTFGIGSSVVGIKKKDPKAEEQIEIIPNPLVTGNAVSVIMPKLAEPAKLEVYNLSGKRMLYHQFDGDHLLKLDAFSNGTYVLFVRSLSGKYLASAKLIIQH